jgi:hypothetical protein
MASGAHEIDVIAGALAAACGDPEVIARLGGPLGEAVRAALPARADRATRLGWAAVGHAAVPAGLRGVHPSWIEAGLAGLPERARAAVASSGGDPVDTWLARWATAAIPPMPAIHPGPGPGPGPVTSIDAAIRADAATLEGWLADAGADQLALALGVAGAGAVIAAARVVGDRLRAAAARIGIAPRAGALGPARAAIERCRVALDDRAVVRIGARAIAPYVGPLARRQLAHRLPRPLGQVVADELAAAAGAAIGDAPRWEALAAPATAG